MKYSELINSFVEGEISPEKEQELFYALSNNESLRSELKQFIDIERTPKYDVESFAPTPESTASVFSRVGIKDFSLKPPKTTIGGFSIKSFWSKYAQGVVGALGAGVITAVIMFFAMNDDASQTQVSQGVAEKTKIERKAQKTSKETSVKEVPTVSSFEKTASAEEKRTSNSEERVLAASEEEEKTENNVAKEINEDLDLAAVKETEIARNNLRIIPVNVGGRQFNNNIVTSPTLTSYSSESIDLGKIGISLEVAGTEFKDLPQATLPHSSEPLFENNYIALIYKVNDKFYLGADLRREFFFQNYTGSDGEGKYRIEQNTHYDSYGLFGRYKFFRYKNAAAFGQLSLGGNVSGPYARLALGTEISPSVDYSFTLGVEGSVLSFEHQNNRSYTGKIGFIYGFLFNL